MKAVEKAWYKMSVLVILLVALSGCTVTIPPAVIDAAQEALTNKPPVVTPSPATNPASVTPVATVTPTGPLVVPLSYLGNESDVDGLLAAGKYAESDNRSRYKFQLLRPDGKSWSFADFVESGAVAGDVAHAVVFHGQAYTPVYQSEHDQGVHMPGHAIKDGDVLGGERFVYFECRAVK